VIRLTRTAASVSSFVMEWVEKGQGIAERYRKILGTKLWAERSGFDCR